MARAETVAPMRDADFLHITQWAVLGKGDTQGREVDFPVGCSSGVTHDEYVLPSFA